MALTRDDILSRKLRQVTVQVPEWEGEVILRELTAGEREEWSRMSVDIQTGKLRDGTTNIQAGLCALCIVDADGRRIFDGNGDIEALAAQSARALERIFDVALELNGMREEAVESASKK